MTFIIVCLTRVIPLFYDFDPWTDEAMLIANLAEIDIRDVFTPLPLFEQAAPLGYMLAALAVFDIVPDPEHSVTGLRFLSAAASIASAVLIYAVCRDVADRSLGVLAVVFLCLTYAGARYGLEIKHYSFEILATSLLLFTTYRYYKDRNGVSLQMVAAAAIFAILFSFTAPIVIAASFVPVLLLQAPKAETKWLDIRMLALSIAMMLVFLVYYFSYTTPVTENQFAGYSHIYHDKALSAFTFSDLKRLVYLLAQTTWVYGPRNHWPYAFTAIFVLGAVFLLLRARHILASVIIALVFVMALSAANIFPAHSVRHLVFLLPLLSIILASGIYLIVNDFLKIFCKRHHLVTLVLTCLVLVPFATVTLIRANKVDTRQNISPLLDHVAETSGVSVPVFVYYGAQPVMRVMAPVALPQIGLVDHRSQVPGWIWQLREYPGSRTSQAYFDFVQATLSDVSDTYLLFTHYWPEIGAGRGGLDRFWQIATDSVGPCKALDLQGSAILWRCTRE